MSRLPGSNPLGRTWLWLAVLLSALLHTAVAAVLWRTDRPPSTTPGKPVLAFELVRVGTDTASTDEPMPDTPALPPEAASSSVSTTTVQPAAPAPSKQRTRQVAPHPASNQTRSTPARASRSNQTRESKNQRAGQPQTQRPATTEAATTGSAEKTGNSGSTKTPPPSQAAAERAYLNALQRAIARHQRYPAGARRHGQSGVATLAFVIDADGRLSQIRLAQSSGHDALDRAALQALARLGRFDPIPKSLGRRIWSLRIPIRFDLQ
jgi:periplasmic protein TonB